jgi:hypothetical protein
MLINRFNSEEITLLTAVLYRVCADEHVVDEAEITPYRFSVIDPAADDHA